MSVGRKIIKAVFFGKWQEYLVGAFVILKEPIVLAFIFLILLGADSTKKQVEEGVGLALGLVLLFYIPYRLLMFWLFLKKGFSEPLPDGRKIGRYHGVFYELFAPWSKVADEVSEKLPALTGYSSLKYSGCMLYEYDYDNAWLKYNRSSTVKCAFDRLTGEGTEKTDLTPYFSTMTREELASEKAHKEWAKSLRSITSGTKR